VNCQKKEFAHRSKRSLNLKERVFLAVRSLSDVIMVSLGGGGAVYSKNTCGLREHHEKLYLKTDLSS
jgi:hypothetical protein